MILLPAAIFTGKPILMFLRFHKGFETIKHGFSLESPRYSDVDVSLASLRAGAYWSLPAHGCFTEQ